MTGTTRAAGRRDEAPPYKIGQGTLAVDGRQPRDRTATARDQHLGTLRDAPEMLAQAIVKLADAYRVLLAM